jgi:uncharacterized protein (TIGR03437 family)
MAITMERKRKLFWAKTGVILAAIPVLIWAHEYGPDAGYCAVPKEGGTCNTSGCHTGTAVNGGGGAGVSVAFPNGLTYAPGVKQHLVVTIADPAQRAWGFQLTARLASNSSTMAGSFAFTDANTLLMCADPNLITQTAACSAGAPASCQRTTPTCPSNQTQQYMEHSLVGYNATKGKTTSATYEFDWTPPSSDVGDIVIYAAGNAANGDLTQNGDHIYTKSYTLSAASAGGSTPQINSSGGVQSASGFGGFSAIAPATWVEIFGSNLASNTRQWGGADFTGVNAPTSLDGTKVTIGGRAAFVYFISSGQVNAQVPSDVATGTQQVTVTTSGGTSNSFNVTINALQPGLLSPASFNLNGKQYVVAQLCEPGKTCTTLNDLTFVLPAGSLAGSGFLVRPAKPGENLTIYGIGFGPVIDSSNVNIPAGQIVGASNQLVNQVQMQVNGVPANLTYAGLAPGQVGVYQFNLVVPVVPDGDWPLTFTQNGAKGTQTLLLSVHQ